MLSFYAKQQDILDSPMVNQVTNLVDFCDVIISLIYMNRDPQMNIVLAMCVYTHNRPRGQCANVDDAG